MHKFTHISAFYQVARSVAQMNADPECPERYKVRGPVHYRGTVKLHGSNAGVQCHLGGLMAQSRSRTITPSDDNYGFAAFVEVNANSIRAIESRIRDANDISDTSVLVLYGEWVGPGVQGGVAVSKLAQRQWVLFAVRAISGEEGTYIDALPTLGEEFSPIFSIADAPTFALTVDYGDLASKEAALDFATETTEAIEAECPWAARFGVAGIGEGIVWLPVGEHWGNSNLFFKSKGDKHQVVKTRAAKPQLTPEVLEGIEAFVSFAVTDVRLAQGLEAVREAGHTLEMRSMPHFLKWVGQDVRRECEPELTDNGLEWKTVSKAVTRRARDYFKQSVEAAAMASAS